MLFRRRVSDKALIDRVLRGQRDEFARLVDRYLPMVHALAYAHVGNVDDADDVTQEAFLKAYSSLDTLQNRAAFRSWLAAIARNAALSVIRARKPSQPIDPDIPSDDDPRREAERRDLHEILRREVFRLTPEFREVLVLHYFSGLKIREVAETIGASPEATAKRIQRARAALGEHLTRDLGLVGDSPATDLRGTKTKILAAIATASVAWEANAMAGVGGLALSTKLLAAMASIVVLAAGWGWYSTSIRTDTALSAATTIDGTQHSENEGNDERLASEPSGASATPAEAETSSPTIPHDGPGSVRGRVVFPNGSPAPGMKVVLGENSYGTPPSPRIPKREALADVDGNFEFDTLPLSDAEDSLQWYWVVAYDGESSAASGTLLRDDVPSRFVWLELKPAGKIAGRVVDASGAPVAGAVVTPSGCDDTEFRWSPIRLEQATDRDGAFSFSYLWPGSWRFLVQAPGYARMLSDTIELGDTNAVFELRDACVVQGRAVDPTSGAPISGLRVQLEQDDTAMGTFETETNDDGTWSVADMPPGDYTVKTKGAYYLADEKVNVTLPDYGSFAELSLDLHLGATIEGRVTRSDSGEPVTNPPVECMDNSNIWCDVRAESDGTYRVEGLVPGRYEIALRLMEHPKRSVTVEEGKVYQADFEVAEGDETLSGIVVDPDGNPVSGARLELDQQGKTTTSGSDGSFAFDRLASARYSQALRVYKAGMASTSECLDTKGSQDNVRAIVGEPSCIVGRVVDDRGAPVAGAMVNYRLLTGPLCGWHPSQTTDGGRFALSYLVPGEYTLSVERQGMPKVEVDTVRVAPGQILDDVVLAVSGDRAEGKLAGTVTDSSGKPLVRAWIVAHGPRQSNGEATTDAHGAYAIDGLTSGVYSVEAIATGFANVKSNITVPTAESADFVLQKPATISARVFDAATRAPLTKFKVAFVSGDHTEDMGAYANRAALMASETGEFALNNLAPGPGTLAAWADGYAPAWIYLDLPEGDVVEAQDLLLTPRETPSTPKTPVPTVTVSGSVLDTQRRPVAGANIYVQDVPHPNDRITRRNAVSDSQGRFSIDNVPITTTRLFAAHDDFATAGTEIALRQGLPGRADIVMPASGTVTGTVLMNGKPVAGAWTNVDYVLLYDRIYENCDTDGQGRFSIANIPPGDATANLNFEMGTNLYRCYEQPVVMTPGGTVDVLFDLTGGSAAVQGTITANGEPVQATITVIIPRADGTEDVSKVSTHDDGTFVIPMLPETPLTLHVRDEEKREKDVQLSPSAAETTEVNVDLAD